MTYRHAQRVNATFDPATSPSAPGAYRIRAMLDGLDAVAAGMERRWGAGRLRRLASDPLRLRFDEQQARVDAATASGEEQFVQIQTGAMQRAWETLERAAIESGAEPLSGQVWETALPGGGGIIALVRSAADMAQVSNGCPAFTLAEIARMIEALGPEALEAKRVFPGAVVARVRADEPFDWSKGDEIPF
jgi:hypothetical protein